MDRLALVQCLLKVYLHLFFVLDCDCFHALEVSENFLVFINLLQHLFSFILDFVDVPLKLGNQLSHLVLVFALLR